MNKKILLAILIFAGLVSLPLMKSGFYTVHDDQQIARLFLFDKALKTGQFPVRWVDGLGFGFGYPLFIFYPPLVYIAGEIFHLGGFGFIDSVKLVFFASIFLSGVAMFIAAKEFWGKYAGITASISYIFLPYRALDVYVRGALAESFAFVWLPLIFWSFYKLYKDLSLKNLYLSSIFLGFLMITHNLVFLPLMLLLPFYLIFLILNSPNKKLLTVKFMFSLFLALGLSAFFWLPSLAEKKFTIVDQLLTANLASYKIHFVYPQQLWNWAWGFGGSAAGLADGISFKIGKLHVLISIAAFLFSVLFSKNFGLKSIKYYKMPLVMFLLFLFSAFMSTFYSKFIWDKIAPLWYLQFPWRFLIFTGLFSSFLAGYFIYFLRLPVLKLFSVMILSIFLIYTNLKLFRPQTYRLNLTDKIATSDKIINWDVSSSSFEYLPKGVDLKEGPLGTNIVNIDESMLPRERIVLENGSAIINNLHSTPNKIDFQINARENSKIRINNYNFPGWEARVDNSKIPIDDNNPLKLITFNLPKGEHFVSVNFQNSTVVTLGNSLSLISILGLVLYFFKWETRKAN